MIFVRTVVAEAENRELALAEAAALAKAHALRGLLAPAEMRQPTAHHAAEKQRNVGSKAALAG